MVHKEVIIDTGYLVALFSKTDQFHKQAVQMRKKIDKRVWMTTWPVLTEVIHLLSNRGFSHVCIQLMSLFEKGGIELFQVSVSHIPRIIELLEKYNTLPIDLADASLIVLAEELGHGDIVSTDSRDFKTYRWKSHHPFQNMMC